MHYAGVGEVAYVPPPLTSDFTCPTDRQIK